MKRLVEGSDGGLAGVAAVADGGTKVEVEKSRLKLLRRGAAAVAALIAILGFGVWGLEGLTNSLNLGSQATPIRRRRGFYLEREKTV